MTYSEKAGLMLREDTGHTMDLPLRLDQHRLWTMDYGQWTK